jgi:hypothetical protein
MLKQSPEAAEAAEDTVGGKVVTMTLTAKAEMALMEQTEQVVLNPLAV